MKSSILFTVFATLIVSISALAQRPGMRPGGPPINPPRGEWIKPHDTDNDGAIDEREFNAAAARTFTEFDRNGDGQIDAFEAPKDFAPRPPRPGFGVPNRSGEGKRLLPPFFFDSLFKNGKPVNRPEFEQAVRSIFNSMDANNDGVLRGKEVHPPMKDGPARENRTPPNARFIAAELRYGDKLVRNQPFSADIVIEDTKRLFDGSTATKTRKGAIYRDREGRTRREQPLETIAGFAVVGKDNKPPMLVFINDFAAGTQTFLDFDNKVARSNSLGVNAPPREPKRPENAKTESLGTRTIEGVQVEGTRVTFEIPAGEFGNDRPLQVVTETWFSSELQMVVMSRHVDPVAGEHVFKLNNIKRVEPSPELFTVPAGFRVENKPDK